MTQPIRGPFRASRNEVLRRIRQALEDQPSAVPAPRDYERALPPETDVVELFVERAGDYRATVHRTTSEDLSATIAAIAAAHGARRLVVPAGIPGDWLTNLHAELVGDDPPLTHAELDELDGVITGCSVAIAETGTIILDTGADQGRRALTLLPDLHICVVSADLILGTVPEALARLAPARPQTWISGPSATSDIELQRVEGVHGPRILDVIVIEG